MLVRERPTDEHGTLQEVIDELFDGDKAWDPKVVRRLDVVLAVEWADLTPAIQDVVRRLPPGDYTHESLRIQLNSILIGHDLLPIL